MLLQEEQYNPLRPETWEYPVEGREQKWDQGYRCGERMLSGPANIHLHSEQVLSGPGDHIRHQVHPCDRHVEFRVHPGGVVHRIPHISGRKLEWAGPSLHGDPRLPSQGDAGRGWEAQEVLRRRLQVQDPAGEGQGEGGWVHRPGINSGKHGSIFLESH